MADEAAKMLETVLAEDDQILNIDLLMLRACRLEFLHRINNISFTERILSKNGIGGCHIDIFRDGI